MYERARANAADPLYCNADAPSDDIWDILHWAGEAAALPEALWTRQPIRREYAWVPPV